MVLFQDLLPVQQTHLRVNGYEDSSGLELQEGVVFNQEADNQFHHADCCQVPVFGAHALVEMRCLSVLRISYDGALMPMNLLFQLQAVSVITRSAKHAGWYAQVVCHI